MLKSYCRQFLSTVLCAAVVSVTASAAYAAPFRSVQSASDFSNSGYECTTPVSSETETGSFFNALAPSISSKGAVKTFSVRVARKGRSSGKESAVVFDPAFGTLLRPVAGYISSGFGTRRHPKTLKIHRHTGIDIPAVRGTPIACAAAGKVVFVGWKTGYGKTVIVDHGNGLSTVYAHCSKTIAKEGQSVNAGQRIANVGRTGVATGSHLHFEVRRNDSPMNPIRFLKK